MDELELMERISKGEDTHTEFKERMPHRDDLAKLIVCFANTDGGQIIIGVSDSGEILGVGEDVDKLMRLVDDVAFNRCEPPITVVQETVRIDDKTVLVINVPKGDQRPYRTSDGRYYVRGASRCRQASREELLRLFQAAGSMFYDVTEIYGASYLDLDVDYFKSFIAKYIGVSTSDDMVKNYMKNLKVLSASERPTLAGILFFGRNPQHFVPYAKIISAYIEGDSIATPPSDKKEITGRIPQMLEDCMKFLRLYLKEEHRIKGLEPEAHLEIPEEALREAIVNAVAHRDYTVSSPVRVFVFKDRIEFRTPGKLPNSVTIESMKIGGAHVLRNPTIYNLLAKMGLVTDIGSGVLRIIKLVKDTVGKDVGLYVIENEFVLIIPRKET